MVVNFKKTVIREPLKMGQQATLVWVRNPHHAIVGGDLSDKPPQSRLLVRDGSQMPHVWFMPIHGGAVPKQLPVRLSGFAETLCTTDPMRRVGKPPRPKIKKAYCREAVTRLNRKQPSWLSLSQVNKGERVLEQ